MADKPTGSNGVLIAVAVIGALGAIGAALVALNKPKDQTTPSVQQTSSGAGAINAGRDAIVTNNIKSLSEEAAERVQACEDRHGMKQAVERPSPTKRYLQALEMTSKSLPTLTSGHAHGPLLLSPTEMAFCK